MDTPIGIETKTGSPVTLPHPDRFVGTYIVGTMGMGKSTLIQAMVSDQLASGHGCCVIEPKGDLVQDILRRVPKKREGDVVLLDYGDMDYPPGFDIFNTAGVTKIEEKAAYIREAVASFEKTLGRESWGTRMENLFMAVANTFTENPGSTLADIKRILIDDDFRHRCMEHLTSVYTQDAREFWERYDRMKTKDAYIESTLTRVQRFLFDPILLAVTIQAGKSFDFDAAIHKRQIVLISLPERKLGPKGVDLLGTLYLSRIRLATQMQFDLPEQDRVPFFVYLDEFQRFATKDVESFIAEARGARVGLTMAHQWRSQLEDPGVRQAPMAAGNTIVFRVTTDDASSFARAFQWKSGVPEPFVYEEEPALVPAWNDFSSFQYVRRSDHVWEANPIMQDEICQCAVRIAKCEYTIVSNDYDRQLRRISFLLWSQESGIPPSEVRSMPCPEDLPQFRIGIDMPWRVQYGPEYRDKRLRGLVAAGEEIDTEKSLIGKLPYPVPYPRPPHPGDILRRRIDAWMSWRIRSEGEEPTLDAMALHVEMERAVNWYIYEVWRQSNAPGAVSGPPDFSVLDPMWAFGREEKSMREYRALVDDVKWLGDALALYGPYLFGPGDLRLWRETCLKALIAHQNRRDTGQEIATALANLPQGEALAKLSQNGVATPMKLRTVIVPEPAERADIERIRARSRALYCMPMLEAVALMQQRGGTLTTVEDDEMAFFDTPAPVQPKPRRGPI